MRDWIARSEREPEKKDDCSERYLAWNGEYIAIITHGWTEADGSEAWLTRSGEWFHFTHWMELPEPPTSGETK